MLRFLSVARRAALGSRPQSAYGGVVARSSRALRSFSTVLQPQHSSGSEAAAADEGAGAQSDVIPYSFESNFHVGKTNDIYTVQEGGFLDLDDAEIKQFFPEGLAGEMNAEFDFSGRKSWMIRDTSKLLCRLVDDFDEAQKEKRSGGSDGNKSSNSSSSSSGSSSGSSSTSVYKAVSLPNLTDRPEWASSSLSVQYFGKELMPTPSETIANPSRLRRTGMQGDVVRRDLPTVAVAKGPGSTIDNCLAKLKQVSGSDAVPSKIMLTGARGVGKSAALNHMVMHARKRGWLCLFVPHGWDQVQSGAYVEPVSQLRGEAARGILDNPFMSADVLRGVWKAHHSLLSSIPLKFPKEADKYKPLLAKFHESYDRAKSVSGREKMGFRQMRAIVEGEDAFPEQDVLDAEVLEGFDYATFKPEPKTLADLVRLGVAFRDFAGSVLMDFVAELKQVESVPVLIAVDQYNAWEAPSAFSYRNEPVHARQLCVPHSLRFLSKKKAESEAWTLKNGLCVCATSLSHAEGRRETFEDVKSSVPLVIKVPAYSRVEFLSAVSFYMHQSLIAPGTTTQELLAFRMLAGSNPYTARREAVPFFFPINVDKLSDEFSALGTGGGTDLLDEDGADGGGDSTANDDVGSLADSVGGRT